MTNPNPNSLMEDFTLLGQAEEMALSQQGLSGLEQVLLVAAVLILLALAWLLWRRRVRLSQAEPEEPPHVIALRELRQWQREDDFCQRDAVVQISATLRRYLQGRFGLRAPTLTSEEFWQPGHLAKIPRHYHEFWRYFFAASDGIKYAGLQPSERQFRELTKSAIQFVLDSQPQQVADDDTDSHGTAGGQRLQTA